MSLLDKAPRVKNCCFCISLPVGALIVSVLEIFSWAIMSVLRVILMFYVPLLVKYTKEAAEKEGKVISPSDLEALAVNIYISNAIWIFISIASWIFCIYLWIGVIKQNTKLMKAWLWFELVMIMVYILFNIYIMIKMDVSVVGICFEIIIIGIRIYWFFSINSYRMTFEKGQNQSYEMNVNFRNV